MDGVLNIDAIRDGVGDERVVGVAGGNRDWAKDESGGGGAGEGVWGSGGMEVVHDVARRAIKLKLVDSEGHPIGSWWAEGKVG